MKPRQRASVLIVTPADDAMSASSAIRTFKAAPRFPKPGRPGESQPAGASAVDVSASTKDKPGTLKLWGDG